MFEQVTQKMTEELSAKAQEINSAPEPKEVEEKVSEPKQDEQPSVPDLDSLEKFKFDGKEWTAKDLKSAYLMQSDYTKKTQELAQERKFAENFSYDLATVLENPSLMEKLKEVYPAQYVKHAEALLAKLNPESKKEPVVEGQKPYELPKEVAQRLAKVDEIEKKLFEKEVQAMEAQLDTIFGQMSKKYPFADEEAVISRAQALIDKGANLDDKAWDNIWSTVNEKMKKTAESYYKEINTKQKEANHKAKDIGSGGGIPGSSPNRITFKEATEKAIRDLGGR